jgi:hypothetical protein
MTIGGLAGWAIRAVNADEDGATTTLITVPLTVGF